MFYERVGEVRWGEVSSQDIATPGIAENQAKSKNNIHTLYLVKLW